MFKSLLCYVFIYVYALFSFYLCMFHNYHFIFVYFIFNFIDVLHINIFIYIHTYMSNYVLHHFYVYLIICMVTTGMLTLFLDFVCRHTASTSITSEMHTGGMQ